MPSIVAIPIRPAEAEIRPTKFLPFMVSIKRIGNRGAFWFQ